MSSVTFNILEAAFTVSGQITLLYGSLQTFPAMADVFELVRFPYEFVKMWKWWITHNLIQTSDFDQKTHFFDMPNALSMGRICPFDLGVWFQRSAEILKASMQVFVKVYISKRSMRKLKKMRTEIFQTQPVSSRRWKNWKKCRRKYFKLSPSQQGHGKTERNIDGSFSKSARP